MIIQKIPEGQRTCTQCKGHYIEEEVPDLTYCRKADNKKPLALNKYHICPECWVDPGPRMTEVVGALKNALQRCTLFKLSFKQYCQILKDQDYSCARCKVSFTRFSPTDLSNAHIDHDHECCKGPGSCGKCVRGITCVGCNLTMHEKWCRDNPDEPYLVAYRVSSGFCPI